MNTLDSVVGYGAPKFGRVKGLHQSMDDTNATNGLQNFVKNEVGTGFFKFISKLGSMFGASEDNTTQPSGGHKDWLGEAGFKPSDFGYINYIVSHESGWNPRATNPQSGAYGIPQSLPGYQEWQQPGNFYYALMEHTLIKRIVTYTPQYFAWVTNFA